MVTTSEDETVPEMPKEKPFSFEDIAAPKESVSPEEVSPKEAAKVMAPATPAKKPFSFEEIAAPKEPVGDKDSANEATPPTPDITFSPFEENTTTPAATDVPSASSAEPKSEPAPEPEPIPEFLQGTSDFPIPSMPEERAAAASTIMGEGSSPTPAPEFPVSDFPATDEALAPAMPVEVVPDASALTDAEASADSEASGPIPDMPVGEAPEAEPNGQSRYAGLGDDEGQNDKPDAMEVLNTKLLAGIDKFTAWAKPRRSFLIKLGIVLAAFIFLTVTVIKLSIVPIVSVAVKNVLDDLGLKNASFTVAYADTNNIILSNVQDSEGSFIAKEITIVYSLSGFLLSDTIDDVSISGLELSLKAKDGKLEAPFFGDDSDVSRAADLTSKPKYLINRIRASQSKAVLFGYLNGTSLFSFSGKLDKQLKLSVPMSFNTDSLSGPVDFNIAGWGGDLDITISTKGVNFTDSKGYTATITTKNANLAIADGRFKRADFTADYKLGQYNMNIKSDIKYINDKFDADITLNTSLDKDEAAASASSARSSRGRFARRTTRPQSTAPAPQKISEEKISSLPTGDLKVFVKGASLNSKQGFTGDLPIAVSSGLFSWGDFIINNAKLNFNGRFSCKDKSCSYTLNENATLSMDKLSFPVMNTGFEAMEKVDLELAKIASPLFVISSKDLLFNVELARPALTGSVAEAKSSNVFLLEAARVFAEGSVNLDGGFEADITIDDFNFSDSSYLLKDSKASITLSSTNSISVKLQSELFRTKSGDSIIAPSSIALETRPQGNYHQFKLISRQKEFGTSQIFSGIYDYAKSRAVANFIIPEMTFSDTLKPKQVFPFVGDYLTDVKGKFSAEGSLTWTGVSLSGPAKLTFKDFSASKGYAKVSGLNSTFFVSNFNPITTGKPQAIKADKLDILLPFKNVELKVAVSSSGLTISDFSAELAGGKVDTLETLSIPYALSSSPYMLLVKGAKLEKLDSVFNIPAKMSGTFDARLPMTLRPNDVSVTLGDITSVGEGSIKSKAKVNDKSSDFAKVFSDLKYTKIAGTVDASLTKNTSLHLNVEGTNPDVDFGEPFKQTVKFNAKTNSLLKSE